MFVCNIRDGRKYQYIDIVTILDSMQLQICAIFCVIYRTDPKSKLSVNFCYVKIKKRLKGKNTPIIFKTTFKINLF